MQEVKHNPASHLSILLPWCLVALVCAAVLW
jgi:hypothetical protein